MVWGHEQQEEFEYLPEWERDYFHLLNCPSMQVGYYDRAIGQEFIH